MTPTVADRARAGLSIRLWVRCLSPILLSAVAMSFPVAWQAAAQQISTNPPNGAVFDLPSDITQSQTVSLANGATLTVNGNGHTLTLSGGAFFNFPQNPAAATLVFGSGPAQTITITGGSRSNGGAISGSNVASGTSIPITGSATFSNNVATGNGGAIGFPNLNGTLSIGSPGSTAIFTGNTAQNGGAIDDANAALALFGNATFSGNVATSGSGGGIHNTGGQFVIIGDSAASNITFINNTAAQDGGAVSAQNNSVTVNGNVKLAGNMAGGRGGAIFEGSNSVTVGNTGSTVSITNNTAGSDGGAIWSQNSGVTINGANITLQQNMAGGNGGAVFEANGPVLIGDASGATVNITGNTAGSNGGAVYANNGSVTVNGNVTLMDNIATSGSGGGIYETNNAVLISKAEGTSASPATPRGLTAAPSSRVAAAPSRSATAQRTSESSATWPVLAAAGSTARTGSLRSPAAGSRSRTMAPPGTEGRSMWATGSR